MNQIVKGGSPADIPALPVPQAGSPADFEAVMASELEFAAASGPHELLRSISFQKSIAATLFAAAICSFVQCRTSHLHKTQKASALRQTLSFLLFFRFTQLCADIAATVEDADYGDLMQTGIR